VLFFSFLFLIPKGKEYRIQKSELRKENLKHKRYENFDSEIYETLKKLQADNRHIITAFDTSFNAKRFQKQHKSFFSSLTLSEKTDVAKENEFSLYEVNTTSQVNSPKSFYDFLDALNRSDWIIKVNFPINFKRDFELIRSSFTMRVYAVSKDLNSSK
ncbi:MAG: hypothetical protein J7L21_00620, partial [Sulfurimonas sp.]|nr:hypothetical protein [Sulfurimonas sp.]